MLSCPWLLLNETENDFSTKPHCKKYARLQKPTSQFKDPVIPLNTCGFSKVFSCLERIFVSLKECLEASVIAAAGIQLNNEM